MMPVRESDQVYHDPFAPKKAATKKKAATISQSSSSLKKAKPGGTLSTKSSKQQLAQAKAAASKPQAQPVHQEDSFLTDQNLFVSFSFSFINFHSLSRWTLNNKEPCT